MKQFKYTVNGRTFLLPESEVQGFLQEFPNAQLIEEIDEAGGKQTGVPSQAASATPENVAAVTGLESGTSLSESQRLAAPIAQPVQEKSNINQLLQQKISDDNLNIEQQASLLFKIKSQDENIGFDKRTPEQKALDLQ